MKYIKLTGEAIDAISQEYETNDFKLWDNKFWESFEANYPQHIVESVPTENKEREELLMVAAHIGASMYSDPTVPVRSWEQVVNAAQNLIAAVNAVCETKEDKA